MHVLAKGLIVALALCTGGACTSASGADAQAGELNCKTWRMDSFRCFLYLIYQTAGKLRVFISGCVPHSHSPAVATQSLEMFQKV